MRIQEAVQRTGLTRKAIHFYIDSGLLAVSKAGNQYYDFKESDIQRLNEIKMFRQLGTRIETIRKIYQLPCATNYYLNEERNFLYASVKEKMNALINLTYLLDKLPHNALPDDLIENVHWENDAEKTSLSSLPSDMNYRMLAIYLFAPYTDEFATEYRQFLWKKIEREVQIQFGTHIQEACDYLSMKSGKKMYEKCSGDFDKHMYLFQQENLKPMADIFLKELEEFLSNEKAVAAWNTHQECVYQPALKAYLKCSKEVLREFSNRYSVCEDKIFAIIAHVEQQPVFSSLRNQLVNLCHVDSKKLQETLFLLFLFNPKDYL